jgi:hypothetical protein
VKKWVIFFLLLFVVLVWTYVGTTLPFCPPGPPSAVQVDPARLRGHVEKVSIDFAPRNYKRIWNLDKCADYISGHFTQAGGRVVEQTYSLPTYAKGTYRNVVATFGPEDGPLIVVGGHYDAFQDVPGADDNGSAVAGLIELAYLLGKADLQQRVELVAFTLEEPPFFRTGNMGSARYAYGLKKNGTEVEAMICLEMIGYFSDEPGSQDFPSYLLKWFYPDCGNFIALIGLNEYRGLHRKVKGAMRGATDLPVHAMCAAKGTPGIDFSDHRNFWIQGYPAIMVTDTAFLRNRRYHAAGDTADRLDYDRMSKVVAGVYEAVIRLANTQD